MQKISNLQTLHAKTRTMKFYQGVILSKDADGISNSEDPDQTAP